MLSPPSSRRERILVFGPSGSGKSSTWISVGDWVTRTHSTAKVRVVDTDHAYEAMSDPSYANTIDVYDAELAEYPKWIDQLQSWRPHVQPDDWLVVDMIDQVRVAAEQHYWYTITGGDMLGEMYLKAEVDANFDTVGPYGKHQGNVTKLYNDFMRVALGYPCHILAIAPAQQVMVNKDGRALNKDDQEYVKFSYKPSGHWRLPHVFHTILLAREIPGDRGSQWNLTTVKERGPIGKEKRAELKGETVQATTGFVGTYLVKVAGWHL